MSEEKEERATFTPGPWVVKHDKQGLPFIGVASDPWTYQGTVATVDTGAGDARLIAAAPELHAQAKILERLLVELAMQGETGTDEALDEVRAVLAKVDGDDARRNLQGPDGPQVRSQYDWPDDPDDDVYHMQEIH